MIDDKTVGLIPGRCSANTKAGHPCRLSPLEGEPYCLFHSRSKKALELRRKRRPTACSRKELLLRLSASFQELKTLHIKPVERIKLEAQLSARIHALLGDVERISVLERIVKGKAREIQPD